MMKQFDLTGKVAIVTGGNGGIGLAYARGLVGAGARVAIWGRNTDKNTAAQLELKELGGNVAAFICDVTDSADVDRAFSETIAHFGQVDICFANAGGGGPRGPLFTTDEEQWKLSFDLNVHSVIDCHCFYSWYHGNGYWSSLWYYQDCGVRFD